MLGARPLGVSRLGLVGTGCMAAWSPQLLAVSCFWGMLPPSVGEPPIGAVPALHHWNQNEQGSAQSRNTMTSFKTIDELEQSPRTSPKVSHIELNKNEKLEINNTEELCGEAPAVGSADRTGQRRWGVRPAGGRASHRGGVGRQRGVLPFQLRHDAF